MEGVRPRPGLPPEPTDCTASLEDQVPFMWADGGVLGPGGRPSFSIFKEPSPMRLPVDGTLD